MFRLDDLTLVFGLGCFGYVLRDVSGMFWECFGDVMEMFGKMCLGMPS